MNRKTQKKVAILLIICSFITMLSSCFLDKLDLVEYNEGNYSAGEEGQYSTIDDSEFENLQYVEGGYGLPSGNVYSDKNIVNILLLGTDERSENFKSFARSDSMIIVSLNLKTDQIKLVSFERGTGVPVLEGEYQGQWDWLTHCFEYGGPSLVMKEIQTAYLLDVNYYARTNFAAFIKLIDAVGGIDIDLTDAEVKYINTIHESYDTSVWSVAHAKEMGVTKKVQVVHTGRNHLNGATAIIYARCRQIDTDWGRMSRQRTVLQAAVNQMKGLNVIQLNKLLNDVLPLIQTNMGKGQIARLMTQAPGFIGGVDMETMVMPQEGTYGSMRGMEGRSLFAVDFQTNAAKLHEFLYTY